MRVIILADGKGARWGNHTGVPKHLLVVDGETLLARMIRLLRERGVSDIVLVGPYDVGVPTWRSPLRRIIIDNNLTANGRRAINGRFSVMPIASRTERTVILLGDVWYSDAAMDAIVEGGPEPCLFARFGPSELTGKPYGEIWANSFLPEHHAETERLMREVVRLNVRGTIRRAGLWECYCLAHDALIPLDIRDHGHAVTVDDRTEDFDYPSDWDTWLALRAALT